MGVRHIRDLVESRGDSGHETIIHSHGHSGRCLGDTASAGCHSHVTALAPSYTLARASSYAPARDFAQCHPHLHTVGNPHQHTIDHPYGQAHVCTDPDGVSHTHSVDV